MAERKPRWAVFVSGFGSNLQAMLDASLNVVFVVSSRADAYSLVRAKKAGITSLTLAPKPNWQTLHEKLCEMQVDFIFLAGFMKIIPAAFVALWSNKMLNVHPSLLPSYPGTHSIERSYADRSDMGVTVHVVTEVLDGGPIVAQRKVIDGNEVANVSLAECEERIHAMEHELVVSVVRSWQ
jgi:phosphoribosylglycinamide formyltransferase 1